MTSQRRKIRQYAQQACAWIFSDIRFGARGKSNVSAPCLIISTPKETRILKGQSPKIYEVETTLSCEILAWEKENILDELDALGDLVEGVILKDRFFSGISCDVNLISTYSEANATDENNFGSLLLMFEVKSHMEIAEELPNYYQMGGLSIGKL